MNQQRTWKFTLFDLYKNLFWRQPRFVVCQLPGIKQLFISSCLKLLEVWSQVLSASCFSLILVHSLQCDTFSSVLAVLHKLLRLNKTRWKLPTCQADCKVVFSWTRTSTHLLLFPVETVLLQCHGRSGRWCPLHTPTTEAPGSVPTDECQPTVEHAFKDKDLSLYGHL